MQINLLPKQAKEKRTTELRWSLKPFIFRFIGVFIVLGILWFFLALRIGYFKKKLTHIETELKTTESLMQETDALIQRKKELDEFLVFLKQHFKRDIFWSDKLSAISRLIPREVWLNEISLRKEIKEKQENRFLDILASVGYLKSDEEMLDMINNCVERIKKDNSFFRDFDNLSLFEITKAGDKERFMNFRFSLSLKQGR